MVRLAEALADFNDAIALGPVRSDFLRARGELKREIGDEKGAIADLDAASMLGPSDNMSGALGASFLDTNDFDGPR